MNILTYYRSLVVFACFPCMNFLLTGPSAFATEIARQSDMVVRVWPGEPPEWDTPEKAEQDISTEDSRTVAGHPVIRLSNVRDVELHVFPATTESGKPSPVTVVICPGGAFNILAWDLEGLEVAKRFQEAGVNAAALKYRVPSRKMEPKWQPAVQDIQRSIAMIRAGKVTPNVPAHVGVLGFSAGGNAAFHAATAENRLYKAVDAADAEISPPDFAALIYPAWIVQDDRPDQFREQIEITAETPPMFLAHAENDKHQVFNSVTVFQRLHAVGVPAALHVFTGSGHGFGARIDGRADDLWPELCVRWMRDSGWLLLNNSDSQARTGDE
ncbi:alpha/beta hydrolase [Rhodopirellula sp. SWK7]|uniref:alpha/beta hydrolase n=1 Tax=Rhodopirellula sp. SWK7 TaxID=595460 RepID=UPI001360B699|nr:alpha/beta hydrolase [Rhodopirellula sp. SWK7]